MEKVKDELTTRRQKKCAESERGHQFPFESGYGTCVHCLLKVEPPKESKK